MKNQKQVKTFLSVFLALVSLQEVAAPCMAVQAVSETNTNTENVSEPCGGTDAPSITEETVSSALQEEDAIQIVQASVDALSITGGKAIPDITEGEAVVINGVVTSAISNITSLTVAVYDATGTMITGKTVTPNTKTYDIHNLDNAIQFHLLTAGTYYYKITATNAESQNYTITSESFQVTAKRNEADILSITNKTVIPNIKQGQCVTINGVVTSAVSNITRLTVGVYDESGNLVTGKTVAPNAKSYNINHLDYYVNFNLLAAGTYYYKITASNSSVQNNVIVNQKFSVGAVNSSADKIQITNGTTIPDIQEGSAVIVNGVVSSSSEITMLTVGIFNGYGKMVSGKTVQPNAVRYNLNQLDAYLDFHLLSEGSYYYMVLATNASNVNQVVVNQNFNVSKKITAVADTIAINGGTVVSDIPKGSAVIVKGTVTSAASAITSVTVGVYDASGTMVTGKTVSPNTASYHLNQLDRYVAFDKLTAGTYTYRVMVSNASQTGYIVTNQSFKVTEKVTPAVDTIAISKGSEIPDIAQGKSVAIHGIVTSASTPITSLTVGVYNSFGEIVTGITVKPNALSYNLNEVDNYVRFGVLTKGTYYYRVFATNGSQTNYAVVNQKFQVTGENSSVSDDIGIANGTTVPNITEGKSVIVKGTVSSESSPITSLTVGVYNAAGEMVTGTTVLPNAMQYDLKKIDSAVKFGVLTAGTYTYRVIATNASKTNYAVVNQEFQVTKTTANSASDAISITNGTTVPNIIVGKSVIVKGTVSSESSPMTSLTVGVYNAAGEMVTGTTVLPNAMQYDLKKADSAVKFGVLPEGTYTYRVLVTNASKTNYAVVNQEFQVTANKTNTVADAMSISNSMIVPNIAVGKSVIVKGTLSSTISPITSLTVGVYNESGEMMTGATVSPNATTYNLNQVDSAVKFGILPEGVYYYRVTATNATSTNCILINQRFHVSGAQSGAVYAQDNISISGGVKIPNITEGKGVVVKGIVTSDTSAITSLTVGVFNRSGQMVTGKTVSPYTTTYDLNRLDSYVNFDLLSADTYEYAVIATNASNQSYVVTRQSFTVSAKSNAADTISITGRKTIPNIKEGKCVIIKGVVKSGQSNITSLTVGVFDASGNMITGRTVSPNATSYDINRLDAYVNFDLLTADTYYYGIIATNASNQNFIVVNQKFTVSK